MAGTIFEDKQFTGIDFSKEIIEKGEYEKCIFKNCIFMNSDLSNIPFSDCKFENCDMTLVRLKNTSFKTVRFINCKMLGLHFRDCNNFLFAVFFQNCILNLASFYKLKIKFTQFKSCNLQEADFAESDLTGSLFDNCDLFGAIFNYSILEKADFITSYNYIIDPEFNRIKKAKFSINGLPGLLSKYNIEIE